MNIFKLWAKNKEDSVFTQDALTIWLINNFINIASNLFKYEGLDYFSEDLTSEIVERGYIFNGVNVAFTDNNLGSLVLPAIASSNLNVYGIPKKYKAVGYNGKTWDLSVDDAILLRNNGTFSPDIPMIVYYCERMADCESAMKVNINTNKTPFALKGDPDALLSMVNMFKQISGNEPVVYRPKTRKGLATEPIELDVIKTNADYLADKLNDSYLDYQSRLLTYLGIDNVSVEKRERLNTAEAGANNEHILANLYLKLKCRQEDWDKVNKMLGSNVKVDINYDFIETLQQSLDNVNDNISNEVITND